MDGRSVEIITGFSDKGYNEYGWRLIDSYKKFNNGYEMIAYTHGIKDTLAPSVRQREQDDIPGLMDFLNSHGTKPEVQGRADFENRWKPKEKASGYSFRFDAYKFCRMVFTMRNAAYLCEKEYMVWLDGDTVIQKAIPTGFEQRALPDDCQYAFLGRPKKYTETGFLVFRIPEALPLLDAWANFYTRGTFLRESEWHSAWLFDRARERTPDIRGHNLTPDGHGHPIHQCWVGTIFDHCKGNRKLKGRSPEAGKWRR
jgi:hypothetical protein